MRALVTYGSKRTGTQGLAEMVRTSLEQRGVAVDLVDARSAPRHLDDYDLVVVGGGLYANRWHRAARRFVRRHTKELRERPVWLFSSGPLDDSASTDFIPPTPQVAKLMERIGARGHMTFGGYLASDASGFPASAMAKDHAGDWRDAEQVDRWVGEVVRQLEPIAA